MGVRASYVAVVIVVVGVDASLIPVNGLLGLNRRGVFVWAGSIIHLLHSRPPHRGKRKGGGGGGQRWRGISAQSVSVRPPCRSLRVSLFPPSLIGLVSHLSGSWLRRWDGHQSKLGDDPGLSCLAGFHVR